MPSEVVGKGGRINRNPCLAEVNLTPFSIEEINYVKEYVGAIDAAMNDVQRDPGCSSRGRRIGSRRSWVSHIMCVRHVGHPIFPHIWAGNG
jgi:hypothetical protein